MNEEKVLYFAKENGIFVLYTKDLNRSADLFNFIYDLVHTKKYLSWDQKGDSDGWDSHSYRITKIGEIRLALYRVRFVNDTSSEKFKNRLTVLTDLCKLYPSETQTLFSFLTKKERKFMNDHVIP